MSRQMCEKLTDTSTVLLEAFKRFCIVVIFGIAFGYIEAAVVVYLRTIFYPAGFTFPLTDFGTTALWKQYLLIETGREVATIVLILTSSYLFGRNRQQRIAFFLTIFAVWDIFYYIWLKVLLDWPGSIMDWDILFLIPAVWASPVAAPILVSLAMLAFAITILYLSSRNKAIKTTPIVRLGFFIGAVIVAGSFCTAGPHTTEPDFESYFYWPLFALGLILTIAVFIKCFLKSKSV